MGSLGDLSKMERGLGKDAEYLEKIEKAADKNTVLARSKALGRVEQQIKEKVTDLGHRQELLAYLNGFRDR